MSFKILKNYHTKDKEIRDYLIAKLDRDHACDSRVKIIPELGIAHGTARIDIAVVNGIMHGYEIKSDKDTLSRLPDQMTAYNSVFDKITLVVGKQHVLESINIIPDWWGVIIAKTNVTDGAIVLNTIREPKENPLKSNLAVAQLLWKEEALNLLEEIGETKGLRAKEKKVIQEKLSLLMDSNTLNLRVRETLCFRQGWRPDVPLMTNGD